MANNPNVNKVVYGNQTVMDISDTTATEGDVVSGKTFYKASGARSTGSAVIPDISNCYQTTDTAETDIQDGDYFPFYDTSASGRRKTLWSNIKAKLKSYFDGIYTPTILLKDTVGWTGKNLLKNVLQNQTASDVTIVVGDDGVITLNGTASADSYKDMNYVIVPNGDYTISSSADSSMAGMYVNAEKLDGTYQNNIANLNNPTFAANSSLYKGYKIGIRIISGKAYSNFKIYPMLRKASITDPTFEPYHETVEECKFNRSEQRVLGAWNVLKYPYYQTTKTENGVTFTDNGDGSITISGTATAETQFFYQGKSAFYTPPKGNYVFKIDQVVSGIQYVVEVYNGGTWVKSFGALYSPYDKLVDVNIDYNGFDRVAIYMKVLNGTVISSPVTVKAVLSLSESNEFPSYAMTNRELTDKAYTTDDTAETDIQDSDYFPFYDTSATAKKKSLWSNIIAKIKAALATVATTGSYYDLVDAPQNETASAGSYTVSLCDRREKYLWNQAYNNTVKRHTGSALAGATSVYIPIDYSTDHIVSIGADNGHDQILKYKTIGIYGGGGLPIQVGLTFSALAYDTDFEVLTI